MANADTSRRQGLPFRLHSGSIGKMAAEEAAQTEAVHMFYNHILAVECWRIVSIPQESGEMLQTSFLVS